MRTRYQTILIVLAATLGGCGVNSFQSSEKDDPAEDAVLALERGDEDAAIETLESALKGDAENWQLVSILALAYAQRAGIEPLTFVQRMGNANTSSGEGDSGAEFSLLFAVMPDATADNISDVETAVSLLVSIPQESKIPGDDFKLAIYQTASFILNTKAIDADGDGGLEPEELMDLSDTSAEALLAKLDMAETLLAANPDDPKMKAAAEQIAKYRADIDASEGGTDEEKLKAFLEARTAAAAGS